MTGIDYSKLDKSQLVPLCHTFESYMVRAGQCSLKVMDRLIEQAITIQQYRQYLAVSLTFNLILIGILLYE